MIRLRSARGGLLIGQQFGLRNRRQFKPIRQLRQPFPIGFPLQPGTIDEFSTLSGERRRRQLLSELPRLQGFRVFLLRSGCTEQSQQQAKQSGVSHDRHFHR